ncbi:hypothetical protein [Staphylococcus pseudintermedius]|uniref:hypothetical protein n=1 Tax=Staphylococcus pseudintermedius TaxID=283734 RepID=UPI000BBCE91C|nr:hypothetical protein [Staphylococcus pseudintermedius]PCE48123.1 hypothetical protein BSR34_11780 [Staphylococcus pseudintermedius]
MEKKVKEFEANGKDYKLKIVADSFGVSGIGVIENGQFKGMIDCVDERDYERIANIIINDPDYVDSDDVYC